MTAKKNSGKLDIYMQNYEIRLLFYTQKSTQNIKDLYIKPKTIKLPRKKIREKSSLILVLAIVF